MAKIAKTHEGKRSFPCYVGSPLPNLLRLCLPRFLPLPVVPFLGARARASGPGSSAWRQRRRPLPRVMASYSYTPDRRFVPCSGAAASALLFFSDPGASFKRLTKEDSWAGERGRARGNKVFLASRNCRWHSLCMGESEKH